jgi:hypothetical protein
MSSNADIYAYQGLVMKLNFRECFQSMVFCMIAKVAGTYAGDYRDLFCDHYSNFKLLVLSVGSGLEIHVLCGRFSLV